MTFKLDGERRGKVEARTHEATGVTVHFRRLGFVEKSKLIGNVGGRVGDLIEALAERCVQKWDGVLMPDGNPAPYSPAALDAVAEQCPDFGAWFNDALLDVSGIGADDAGKVEPPPASATG